MKRLFLVVALLATSFAARGQNRILDTGNQYFSITNYGPGPATLSNLTGLPLGTWPEADSSGELGLKVIVLNPIDSGSGTQGVVLSGSQRQLAVATITTSGSFAAGLKTISLLVVSGTLTIPSTSGTIALTSNQTWNQSVSPDTFPVINYTISSGGTTQAITTK